MATLNVSTTASEWTGTVPTLWDEALWEVSTRLSISDQLAGAENSGAAIIEKFDLTKRAGDTVTFTVIDPLIGEPVSGRTSLEGSEEDTTAATFSVSVTHYRHGTATDELSQIVSVYGRKWEGKAAELIGDWFARRKDDDWMNQTFNTDTIQTLYSGNAASRNAIQPGAYLLPHELRRLAMAAERRGAQPIKTFKTMKSTFPVYCALMSEVDYYNLVNSTDFRQDVRLAEVRGADNPAISGRVNMSNGVLILRLSSVPASTGLYGTYLRPEARLRTALTAGATAVDIGPATQKTGVDYGKYFSQSGSSQLLLVESENISYTGAAATDPGNTGWATVSRAANGTSAVTHAAGSLITQNNLGKVLVFGKNVTMRAWALKPRRKRQERDYEFERGMAIQWIYGLESVQWSDSTVANAVALETYSANPSTI
jgi:N4-gp56 family major capsid protein